MKVLITGGSGNIGAYVIEKLKSVHEITILDFKPPVHYPDIPFLKVDLTNGDETKQAVKGFDSVVHLAAIPNPFNDPGERVLSVNVVTTYNLMEAARENRIPRVIYGGSESASGLGLRNVNYKPEYIPIDEDHLSRPHESYSLGKYFGEVICQEYSRAYGIECVSLRYAWVWLDVCREEIEKIIARRDTAEVEKECWLGAHIFPEDVAQGIALSLDYKMKNKDFPFEAFYLTAKDTFYKLDSLEVIRKLFPGTLPPVKREEYFAQNPRASLFDITKAREQLGYEPQFTWKDFNSSRRMNPGKGEKTRL